MSTPYAETHETRRLTTPEADAMIGVKIPCLDLGFVYLVDYMGGDASIVQAARVSYGIGTKTVNEDRGLIRYLMRHQHTTPFEMVEMKFHLKLPIFVARQMIRHRTANVNEYSGRYSVMPDEFYLPPVEHVTKQSATNRQGGGDPVTSDEAAEVLGIIEGEQRAVREGYERMLELDIRRELARVNLGVAQYTEWYWKNDLHNLFRFLMLRMDDHAQYEIRVYAEAMAKIVKGGRARGVGGLRGLCAQGAQVLGTRDGDAGTAAVGRAERMAGRDRDRGSDAGSLATAKVGRRVEAKPRAG